MFQSRVVAEFDWDPSYARVRRRDIGQFEGFAESVVI